MDDSTGQTDGQSDGYGSIAFVNDEGYGVRTTPRHLGRHDVSFELVSSDGAPRTSELLKDFRITLGGRTAYAGRATTTAVTPTGSRLLCSVALDGPWAEPGLVMSDPAALSGAYNGFLEYWQRYGHVRPEFKVVVADMQTLLADLELWLSQFELGLGERTDRELAGLRNEWARGLGGRTTATLSTLFEKFETAASAVDPEWRAACRVFARRQLHPLLLCSPFLHRTYRKPLGYAGDYEMVNMISRDPFEGSTLFAKLVNLWFLEQPPAQAHRNRLTFLEQRITEVALKAAGSGRVARVLSLGCGPAVEVQEFLKKPVPADALEFTLIDFNQETLDRARSCIEEIKGLHHRRTPVDFVRKSVIAMLKEGPSARAGREQFDLVYCAGLFDYLTDPVCRRLSSQLYEWLRPGGLFISTNVHDVNPWPLVMDFIMDWHLNYRNPALMMATRPQQAAPGDITMSADRTGVNIFLEARKPGPDQRGIG